MRRETLFDLASLTKVVSVTTLTLLLHESGKLDLGDRLQQHLSYSGNFPDVKIIDILTHTGGFIAEDRLWDRVEHPGQVIDHILHSEPQGRPGEQVIYSCFGFIVLGQLLETILGISLAQASKDLVFKPLGMRRHVSWEGLLGMQDASLHSMISCYSLR